MAHSAFWGRSPRALICKSGTADGLTELELTDDAARVNLPGTLWRMPTDEEWTALRSTTDFDWAWDATNLGRTVTPVGCTAWTDPTIFLPAAGAWDETILNAAGFYGCYEPSSLISSNPATAWAVIFSSSTLERVAYANRCYGQSVRPVME